MRRDEAGLGQGCGNAGCRAGGEVAETVLLQPDARCSHRTQPILLCELQQRLDWLAPAPARALFYSTASYCISILQYCAVFFIPLLVTVAE